MLDRLAKEHSLLVTMEENVQKGGFGSAVLDYMHRHHPQVSVLNIVTSGSVYRTWNPEKLKEKAGIDAVSV